MSPGLPASIGVAIPTVYFLETVASPCRNIDDASIPLVDVEVSLLLNTTGPSNSERMLPSEPPSTLIERLIVASSGVRTSNPTLNPPPEISSPVTVGIGESNTSSCPVAELTFLLPTKKSPLSFIPV